MTPEWFDRLPVSNDPDNELRRACVLASVVVGRPGRSMSDVIFEAEELRSYIVGDIAHDMHEIYGIAPGSMARPAASYEVGYGKPPVHTRFKEGQSGNPNGRPKKARS